MASHRGRPRSEAIGGAAARRPWFALLPALLAATHCSRAPSAAQSNTTSGGTGPGGHDAGSQVPRAVIYGDGSLTATCAISGAALFGENASVEPLLVAPTSDGGVILAATVFGGAPEQATAIYVASIDDACRLRWKETFPCEAGTLTASVAVSAAGEVAISGFMSGTISLGGQPIVAPGTSSYFVAKLAANGAPLLGRAFGGPGDARGNGSGCIFWMPTPAVALDDQGAITIAGYVNGTIDFGGGPLPPSVGGDLAQCDRDAFVAHFDAQGAYVYAHRWGDGTVQYVNAVAADTMGNAYVGGGFTGTLDLGSEQLDDAMGSAFLVELDPGGAVLRAMNWGTGADVENIAIDSSGGVVADGFFEGSLGLGTPSPTGGTLGAYYVARLDGAWKPLWARGESASVPTTPLPFPSIAIAGAGDVIVAGTLASGQSASIDLGGGPIANQAAGYTGYVARWSATGAHRASEGFGGDCDVWGVAGTPSGAFFLSGIGGPVDFGHGIVLADSSPFVVRFQ
jgi:hypothetical protein